MPQYEGIDFKFPAEFISDRIYRGISYNTVWRI